eukprot:TRINITY_DN269_c1_g1_i1.p1 TRINITY_DN269_c1_g1~~TRINITY_DN269_c1_g1_i1.p1  ORF type:complete len:621 (-),score=124.83 TRINITY_DN269_c1_g1_i1:28-1890(-)
MTREHGGVLTAQGLAGDATQTFDAAFGCPGLPLAPGDEVECFIIETKRGDVRETLATRVVPLGRLYGTVTALKNDRGFGFILCSRETGIFFHFSQVIEHVQLRVGDRVRFVAKENKDVGLSTHYKAESVSLNNELIGQVSSVNDAVGSIECPELVARGKLDPIFFHHSNVLEDVPLRPGDEVSFRPDVNRLAGGSLHATKIVIRLESPQRGTLLSLKPRRYYGFLSWPDRQIALFFLLADVVGADTTCALDFPPGTPVRFLVRQNPKDTDRLMAFEVAIVPEEEAHPGRSSTVVNKKEEPEGPLCSVLDGPTRWPWEEEEKRLRPLLEGKTKRFYQRGEIIPIYEDRVHEFKSLAKAHNPVKTILETHAPKYMTAFLNSDGGVLHCGVEDNGYITGIIMTRKSRDELFRGLANLVSQFKPFLDVDLYKVEYVPVLAEGSDLQDLCVVEITVRRGPGREVYFFGSKELVWLRREGAVMHISKPSELAKLCVERATMRSERKMERLRQELESVQARLHAMEGKDLDILSMNQLLEIETALGASIQKVRNQTMDRWRRQVEELEKTSGNTMQLQDEVTSLTKQLEDERRENRLLREDNVQLQKDKSDADDRLKRVREAIGGTL